MTSASHSSQVAAARVIGCSYLIAMATSIFGEVFVRGSLIDYGNAAVTAERIMANTRLFRIGIVSELVTYGVDVALIAALYVLLSPVNRGLALFALLSRLLAESVCVLMAAGGFDVLRILGNAEHTRAFDPDELAALARHFLGAHGALYNVGFVFVGAGSAVFAYLWIKSRYVPKYLGVLGLIGSCLLGAVTLLILVFPDLQGRLYPAYMVPMFFFEVGIGIWLLVKGPRLVVPEETRPAGPVLL